MTTCWCAAYGRRNCCGNWLGLSVGGSRSFSIDIVYDKELLDLMERSGCIGIFLGIESLDDRDLRSVGKRQNHASKYQESDLYIA